MNRPTFLSVPFLPKQQYVPRRRAVCSASEETPLAAALPPTIQSTRAYLAARRPSAIEQQRLDELLALPIPPADAMLLLAARLGDIRTIEALLALPVPPDVNVQDGEGSTAAMRASSRGHVDCLKSLLGTGKVDLARTNNWGYDVCIYVGSVRSSLPNEHGQMAKLLVDAGVSDAEARAEKRWTQSPKLKTDMGQK